MLNVTVICFLASYLVAFGLELGRLLGRSRISRLAMIGFALAGFAAHTLYLYNRSQKVHLPPLLASAHDWVLVLAWVIMLFYLFFTIVFTLTKNDLAVGLFALPIVVLLVCSAYFLNHEPNTDLDTELARRRWGMLHASFLVFGMAAGALGFLSG